MRRALHGNRLADTAPEDFIQQARAALALQHLLERALVGGVEAAVMPASMNQLVDLLAQDLFARISHHLSGGAVDEKAGAGGIDGIDALIGGLQQQINLLQQKYALLHLAAVLADITVDQHHSGDLALLGANGGGAAIGGN